MQRGVFISFIIIAIVTFGLITVFKIEDIPHDKSCHNFDKTSDEIVVNCDDYNTIEKIRYVWGIY